MLYNSKASLTMATILIAPFMASALPQNLNKELVSRADAAGDSWTCADSTHFKRPDGSVGECAPGAPCNTQKFVTWNPCGWIDLEEATPNGNATVENDLPECEDSQDPEGPEEPESEIGGETGGLPASTAALAQKGAQRPTGISSAPGGAAATGPVEGDPAAPPASAAGSATGSGLVDAMAMSM